MKNKFGQATAFFLLGGCIAVLLAAALSILLGSTYISPKEVWRALTDYNASDHQHLTVITLRLPRTIGCILTGSAFAGAGAMMQGVTRNPLADSGLLGINAGASFSLALCFAFLPSIHYPVVVAFSFAGAAAAMLVVYGLTSFGHQKQSPTRLVLAGSAVSALLGALSQAVSLSYNVGKDVLFWSAGGVAGIRMEQLIIAGPILVFGLAAAIFLRSKVSLLSLGEEAARGLGISIAATRGLCMLAVLLLAGTSVALAGPVAFVGLIIPHICRTFTGADYRRILPASMIIGAFFMLIADIVSRLIHAPEETPIGLVFSVIGVPFFIYTARKEGRTFD